MSAQQTPRERWIAAAIWIRWGIAAAILALLMALWFVPQPRHIASDQGPALRVSQQLRGIATAISEYAKARDGQLPPPDSMIQALNSSDLTSPDYFTLREAQAGEPSFFFIPPEFRGTSKPRPVLFTNPTLFKNGYVYVYYEEEYTEFLTGDVNKSFLAQHAPHAIPLK